MPKNVTLYKLLISCPGDITDEIELINDSVIKFNELYSDELGITIQTKHWSKSSYAQSGGKPQALLNEQFINDCDAAVAVFWTRFGSPTDKYGSGTEEEIDLMIKAGKQVFMYFSDKPISPSQNDYEGFQKIRDFRDKYKDKGIYSTYTTNEEFQNMFFAHLSKHFLSEQRVSEIQAARYPVLSLFGIDENSKLCNNLVIQPFKLNNEYSVADYKELIKKLIEEINAINLEPLVERNTIVDMFNVYEPVKFENGIISRIENMAKHLNIKLTNDFFDVGNLSVNKLASLWGTSLDGTDTEKEKYHLIFELESLINVAVNWAPIERAFDKILCFKLALKNNGTAIDEDIEIRINIPKNALISPKEFPKLDEEDIEYLLHDFDSKQLFGIKETAEYQAYSFPKPLKAYVPEVSNIPYFNNIDYEEEYMDFITNAFCFSIFQDADNYILGLKCDYIKHHTAIAFPMPILLKAEISKIKYSITSKNNPEIITGTLDKL